ncbi:MAG: NADH-quinone oxidoreductase subunit J [Chloroflexi bacterium]|nr:NADH-quinone oxidoreductase subunit J [Chloroflexota bacterium]
MAWFVFISLAVLTIGGALGVVVTRNVVHAALALLVSLIAVAGVYLVLFAEFLALVQVLIYGGAIVIVILFALMLTRIEDFEHLTDHRQWPIAAIVAIAVFGIFAATIVTTTVRTTEREGISFEALGDSLFTQWAVPFEVASLVLLVALIGSVVLVRSTGGRD